MSQIIQVKDLTKIFDTENGQVTALSHINLSINKGDIFGIIGMSGAGKSTLIRSFNFLEVPTSGTVIIKGEDLGQLKPKQLRLKRREIGMIFQHFNLLMQKNVLDNIALPLVISGMQKKEARKKAEELLAVVGLLDKAFDYPSKLSGGQKQRVAIARALAGDPQILLCDEATSALDPQTTQSILELLQRIQREFQITIVLITHQMEVVKKICNKVAVLEEGKIIKKGTTKEILQQEVYEDVG